MATYRFKLKAVLPEGSIKLLEAIPGVWVRNGSVFAPHNVAWLIQRGLDGSQVAYTVVAPKLPVKLEAFPTIPGVREWVPEFATVYQKDAVCTFAQAEGGHIWHAPGSGKSLTAILWAAYGTGQIVLITRAAGVRTFIREIQRFTELSAAPLFGHTPRTDSEVADAKFVVVGWENLKYHAAMLMELRPQSLVADECFVGSTSVQTEFGASRIDQIKRGDMVWALDRFGRRQLRPVTGVFTKSCFSPMVRLTIGGKFIVCTLEHQIWSETHHAYIEARRLTPGDVVRVLREARNPEANPVSHPLLRSEVLRLMAWQAAWRDRASSGNRAQAWGGSESRGARSSSDSEAYAGEQSDVGPRSSFEGECQIEGPAISRGPGRQRSRPYRTPETSRRSTWLEDGSGSWDSPGDSENVLYPRVQLQGGHREFYPEDRSGGGWGKSFHQENSSYRCTEDGDTRLARVAGVEVFQPRDIEGPDRGGQHCLGQRVFDLEVEGLHNYFVGPGLLVSNCHRCKGTKRFEMRSLPVENGGVNRTFVPLDNMVSWASRLSKTTRRRLGTTASPIKDRLKDLWGQLDLIEPGAWGGGFKKFGLRYCDQHDGLYGPVSDGTSNLKELQARLSFVTHVVSYKTTHGALPPKRRIVTYLGKDDLNAPAGFAKELATATKKGGTSLVEVQLAAAASIKRKAVIDLVVENAKPSPDGNTGGKVIVFTGRKRDCDALGVACRKALGEGVQVWSAHGGSSITARDAIREAYMAHPGPCVLIGTGDAWGEGQNLQDTDLLLIGMLPYTPGQIRQWEGRVSRHGQLRPVLIQYLVAEGTKDEHVASILINKMPAVEKIVGDEEIAGLGEGLAGNDDEQAIIDSILGKVLGVSSAGDEIDPEAQ